MKQKRFRWLALAVLLLTGLSLQTKAQEVDDLQEYLDQLAAEQPVQAARRGASPAEQVTIPVGLPEVDLSKFSSYTNRSKVLEVKTSLKFVNGIITAASGFAGGTPLLKIMNGATCVVGETSGIDASAATLSACIEAVGIYGGSTFYQCCDVTAPQKTAGVAIYLNSSADTYVYVSGKTIGSIRNPNGGTVTGLESYQDLKDKLDAIEKDIQELVTKFNEVKSIYESLKKDLSVANQQTVDARLTEIEATLQGFEKERAGLAAELEKASSSEYSSLNKRIDDLAKRVENYKLSLLVELNNLGEDVKAQAVSELQKKLKDFQDDVNKLQSIIKDLSSYLYSLSDGRYFFERQWTEEFRQNMAPISEVVSSLEYDLKDLIGKYNDLLKNNSIATVEDAINFGQQYEQLVELYNKLPPQAENARTQLGILKEQYNKLDVIFPNNEEGYAVAPTGITKEIQLGYRDPRGFILTAAGIMHFEQVSGTNFILKNQDDVYVVATKGSATLTAGTKETATVWTGKSLGNGSYTFYSSSADSYITAEYGKVLEPVKAGTALQWTIVESAIDPLEATIKGLEEEAEAAESGEGSLTENDTLRVIIHPCGCTPPEPFVFPVLPSPIRISGDELPIPSPNDGWRPEGFHPYHIPKGSHVILDDVTFRDKIGGDHIIYVDGILEISIRVNIYIWNWEWFIHVGPTGRVIWRYEPGEYVPRIKNDKGGTIDMIKGRMGHLDNSGTVNHTGGTIDYVINRYEYHLTGGIVDFMDNYGRNRHEGGQVRKVRNNPDGTYDMTGGEIRNTVVTVVDTVFVNCGTFNFKGGYLCGYGSRLIYHAKGAKLRIDGGMFCFDNIKDYWIEAHDDFYIRGDEDYQPTVPILLNPSVRIRILYKWIYKFNIVFIGGRPTPRYPLFIGEEGLWLSRNYFELIDWLLPDRWRWHYDDYTNSIEPRDENVEDEDDLQAYLDWLANNQEGTASSTEEYPQVLDLQGRIIYITHRIDIPVGSHIWFKNGQFVPSGTWTDDRVFYIPGGSSARFEDFVIDFSSSIHYYVNYQVVYRYIFDVIGNVYFGPGFHLKGWFDPSIASTDNYWPGAVFRFDPSACIYLNGGRFENIIFLLNTVVNIYVSTGFVHDVYFYLPTACRYEGFRFMAPWNYYSFVLADLKKIKFVGTDEWKTATDREGYNYLFGSQWVGDANGDHELNIGDIVEIINFILGRPSAKFIEAAADITDDGSVNVTDIAKVVDEVMAPEEASARIIGLAQEEAMNNDQLSLTENEDRTLSLCLDNTGNYVAAQFDVRLSDGQTLDDISLNDVRSNGHKIAYAKTGSNQYTVVVYSLDNRPYNGNCGELLNMSVSGNGSVEVDNILFVTSNMAEKRFAPLGGTPTGVKDIDHSPMAIDHYYDLKGRRVENGGKGIYIINGKKHIVK